MSTIVTLGFLAVTEISTVRAFVVGSMIPWCRNTLVKLLYKIINFCIISSIVLLTYSLHSVHLCAMLLNGHFANEFLTRSTNVSIFKTMEMWLVKRIHMYVG